MNYYKKSKELIKDFVIVIVELAIIVSMIVGFLIYESQFQYSTTEETYTQETSNNDSSSITQSIN